MVSSEKEEICWDDEKEEECMGFGGEVDMEIEEVKLMEKTKG
jgi:hypothetical protein